METLPFRSRFPISHSPAGLGLCEQLPAHFVRTSVHVMRNHGVCIGGASVDPRVSALTVSDSISRKKTWENLQETLPHASLFPPETFGCGVQRLRATGTHSAGRRAVHGAEDGGTGSSLRAPFPVLTEAGMSSRGNSEE